MPPTIPPPPDSYDSWTREQLISRLEQLDLSNKRRFIPSHPSSPPSQLPKKKQQQNPFNFAAHPKRKIALKLCYHGSEYSGMEFQKPTVPSDGDHSQATATTTNNILPTVEKVLFDAMDKTKLVDGDLGLEGCGWERCGRTDKGVSAAQQVVSLWVRSALRNDTGNNENVEGPSCSSVSPVQEKEKEKGKGKEAAAGSTDTDLNVTTSLEHDFGLMGDWDEPPSNTTLQRRERGHLPSSDPTELKYVLSLNNVLPSSIRILAWSPVSSNFSARFNCRYRHYKYFFVSEGLDIEAMKNGTRRLLGEHDFRNLCKLDPGKQLTSFKRKILHADVSPVDDDDNSNFNPTAAGGGRRLYVFDLKGTAFLYNQVRHIMAVLFLIGTRLEHPSIISSLLNVDPENPYPPFEPGEPPPQIVATKPGYQMADPSPLVLWDCGYEDGEVSWHVDLDDYPKSGSGSGPGRRELEEEEREMKKPSRPISQRDLASNVVTTLQNILDKNLLCQTIDSHFLKAARQYHQPPFQYFPLTPAPPAPAVDHLDETTRVTTRITIPEGTTLSIPLGGATYRRAVRYEKLLDRVRGDSVDVVNERWRLGKGAKRWAKVLEKRNPTTTAGVVEVEPEAAVVGVDQHIVKSEGGNAPGQ